MELEFPDIVAPAAAEPARTQVAAAAASAIDLRKVDITDVALAQFGDWQADVAKARAAVTNVAWDLTTAKGFADIKSARNVHTKLPRADANKTADALVSKLTAVNKAVRARQALIVQAYDALAEPLSALIDARQAELDAQAAAEAERKATHEAGIATIAGYVELARGKDAAGIAKGIAYVQALVINPAAWQEFAERAEATRTATLASLETLHAQAVSREAEAARVELQRQENERAAQELERQRAAIAAEAAEVRRQAQALEDAKRRQRESDEAAARKAEDARVAALNAQREADAAAESIRVAAAAPAVTAAAFAAGDATEPAPEPERTGTTEGHLLQDVHRGLSDALAGKPDAMLHAREAAAAIKPPAAHAAPEADPQPAAEQVAGPTAAEFIALVLSAFSTRFPTQPKPSPEWWARVRAMGEALQAQASA